MPDTTGAGKAREALAAYGIAVNICDSVAAYLTKNNHNS